MSTSKCTLAVDWLAQRSAASPARAALRDGRTGETTSFGDWNARANQTANLLRERFGIRRGDRVSVLAHNRAEYLDLLFACGKLGAILQNLNWRLAEPELQRVIDDAMPALLVHGGAFADVSRRLRVNQGELIAAMSLDEEDGVWAQRARQSTSFVPPAAVYEEDGWVLCYTGGSTGTPKGALLTHKSISWNALGTIAGWGLGEDDVALLNAPLFHTGGLNVFTTPLVVAGGQSILCERFEVEQVFDLIDEGAITVMFGVPTMLMAMAEHPRFRSSPIERLRLVISGGAPVSRATAERFTERGVRFTSGYGLTEAGPNNFWLSPEEARHKPGAVGRPLPHVEVCLVDDDGEDVTADGGPGELLLRGPHLMAGYWRRPSDTAQAIDGDGWLHTGDIAARDEGGCYRIVGRRKEMFISGGENVFPAEVEDALLSHAGIAEAMVTGMPHPTWGEVGLAAVVCRPGATVHAEALRSFLRARLAAYKVPALFVFVDALPRTAAGKPDRKALRELTLPRVKESNAGV